MNPQVSLIIVVIRAYPLKTLASNSEEGDLNDQIMEDIQEGENLQ